MITPALLLVLALLGGVPAQRAHCGCRPAARGEVPLGGNHEIIQTVPAPVRQVRGSVHFWVNDKPVDKAVVEVFADRPDKRPDKNPAFRTKRLAACMTGADGKFCFPRLPAGRYVLRAGVSNHDLDVFNFVYVEVRVSRGARRASGRPIIIDLTAAD